MRIVVTGSHGFLGSALVASLSAQGHRVIRAVRTTPRPAGDEVLWDPQTGRLDLAGLDGVEAVVHLAGENIAAGRWTAARKAHIRDSRVRATQLLSNALARLTTPPKVFVCASATGYYGDRGDEVLHEDSAPGRGFLAEVCQTWEAATQPARGRGIRVVCLRFGMVLDRGGGALAKLLPPFQLGLGGVLGSGTQYISWVARDDVVGAIQHVLVTPHLHGPINVVSPNPVTNQEFTRTLARVLRRPALLPVPAIMLQLVMGEMAREVLLASTRALPTKLLASGYAFRWPTLEEALIHVTRRDHGA